jgi:hypothetical protein
MLTNYSTLLIRFRGQLILILFLIIWGLISLNNRYALDDICLVVSAKSTSLYGFVSDLYCTKEGAYTSWFLNYLAFKISSFFLDFPVIYNIIEIIAITFSLKFMFNKLAVHFNLIFEKTDFFILPICIFFSTYYSMSYFKTYQGVWFGVNWSVSYVICLSLLFYAIGILFSNKKNTWLLFGLLFGFGGARFHYTLTVIIILFFLWLFLRKNKQHHFIVLKIYWGLAALILATIVFIIAPGNYKAMDHTHRSLTGGIQHLFAYESIKNFKSIFYLLMIKRLPLILLLTFPFYLLSHKFKLNFNTLIIKQFIKKYILFGYLILIIILLFLFCFYSVLIGEYFYSPRTYVMFFFIQSVFYAILFYLLGQIKNVFKNFGIYLGYSTVLIAILSFAQYIKPCYQYAKAYDLREHNILELKSNNNHDSIFLDPLPDPILFLTGEFSNGTKRKDMLWVNDCAKTYYGIDFDIYQKEEMKYYN